MRVPQLCAVAATLFVLACPASASATDSWRWPFAGEPAVVRGFDPPSQPWLAGHRGVDLRADVGEAVLAAGPGVVGYAGLLAGRGVVTVQHDNGLKTTYEPVEAAVSPGDQVAIGDVIGHVTDGHGDCGWGSVCLHWGLRRGSTYLDPLQLVRPTQVRLLPIYGRIAAEPRPAAPMTRAGEQTAIRSGGSTPVPAAAALGLAALGAAAAARRMAG